MEASTNDSLTPVKVGKFIYHQSNPIFRNKISKEGLTPKAKSETWLSDTAIDGKVIFATNSDNPKDWFDTTYDDDIYRIDTSMLHNNWFVDPNFEGFNNKHVITFESIPLTAIELVHKGSGSDMLQESIITKSFRRIKLIEQMIDGQNMNSGTQTMCNKMTINSYDEAMSHVREALKGVDEAKKTDIMKKIHAPLENLRHEQISIDAQIKSEGMSGDSMIDEADTYWHQIQSTICEQGPAFQ